MRKQTRTVRIYDEFLMKHCSRAFVKLVEYGFEMKLEKNSGYNALIFKRLDEVDLKFYQSDTRTAFREAIKDAKKENQSS